MNKHLRTAPHAGFTLLELLVAMGAAMILIAGVYTLGRCATILATKTMAINATGTHTRNTLDRMQMLLQLAYSTPKQIDSTGADIADLTTAITGTDAVYKGLAPVVSGSTASVSGTGLGIKFDRIMGGPYLVTIPSPKLSATATSITVTMDTAAQVPALPPAANDVLAIYTTAIMSGIASTDNLARAKISSSSDYLTSTSVNGTKISYTLKLTGTITTGTGAFTSPADIQYQTYNGAAITPSSVLLRPTAFVITNTSSRPELRYIDSYRTKANGSVDLVNSKYAVLTDQIDTIDANYSKFAVVTFGSRPFVGIVLHIRSRDYGSFLANKEAFSFSSFMGIGSLISLKSNP